MALLKNCANSPLYAAGYAGGQPLTVNGVTTQGGIPAPTAPQPLGSIQQLSLGCGGTQYVFGAALYACGSVFDTLCMQNGCWGVLRRCGVVQGDIALDTLPHTTGTMYCFALQLPHAAKAGPILCTHLAYQQSPPQQGSGIYVSNGQICFALLGGIATTNQQAASWWQQQGVVAVYPLNKPYFEPLGQVAANALNSVVLQQGDSSVTLADQQGNPVEFTLSAIVQ